MQLEFCKLSKPLISWQIVNTASIIIMMDRTGYKFVKFGFQKSEFWGFRCPNVKKKKMTTFCFFFSQKGPESTFQNSVNYWQENCVHILNKILMYKY